MKKVKRIQLKIVIFTAVKNRRILLHGRVFVMIRILYSKQFLIANCHESDFAADTVVFVSHEYSTVFVDCISVYNCHLFPSLL